MWGRDRIAFGEIVSLVRHLPHGAVAGAKGAWPDEIELQAAILEHLDAIARIIYAQGGRKAPGKPLHVPRPGEAERRRDATGDRMRALLERAEGR